MTMTTADHPRPDATAAPATGPIPTQEPQPTELAGQGSNSPLAAACAAGQVHLYRLRSTGTLRHLPFLAPETPARMHAEWFAMRVIEGQRVRQVAHDAGVSVATVRRHLSALALTESIEDNELDDLYEPDVEAIIMENEEDEEGDV